MDRPGASATRGPILTRSFGDGCRTRPYPLNRALAAWIDLSRPAPRPVPRPASRFIHRLTAAEVNEAVAGYRAGSSLRELGSRFGVSRYAISRNLKARGVKLRHTSMAIREIDEAVVLYADGLSLARIGNRLGYHATTIHLALRAAGVSMRDTHGREHPCHSNPQ